MNGDVNLSVVCDSYWMGACGEQSVPDARKPRHTWSILLNACHTDRRCSRIDPIFVTAQAVISEAVESQTDTNQDLRDSLMRGEAVSEGVVLKLMEDKISSPEVAHHGQHLSHWVFDTDSKVKTIPAGFCDKICFVVTFDITGYCLDGFPSLSEQFMSVKNQLTFIKKWPLQPDFIINFKVNTHGRQTEV